VPTWKTQQKPQTKDSKIENHFVVEHIAIRHRHSFRFVVVVVVVVVVVKQRGIVSGGCNNNWCCAGGKDTATRRTNVGSRGGS
jgi:hypothetical protein